MGDLCREAERAAYDRATLKWIMEYAGATLPTVAEGSAINQQTVMLRHSHRFGEHSGIGLLARAVNGGDTAEAQRIMAEGSGYRDINRILLSDAVDARLKQLITTETTDAPGYGYYLRIMHQQRPDDANAYDGWALEVLSGFDRFQVLCALRRGDWGVESLNQRIEQWLFPGKNPGLWYEGRPVMITRNDYNLGLMNGDIGIALADQSGKLRVAFPGVQDSNQGCIRWLSPMRLPDLETAFAMTVHKSQGSEFNHVALILPEARSPVLTRELVYTGITRAKQKFSLLESRAAVFEQAIRASCQ
jgi:exodeoxyribonuclease V alpha subunit